MSFRLPVESTVLRAVLIAGSLLCLGSFSGTSLVAEESRPRTPVPAGGAAKVGGAKPAAAKPAVTAPLNKAEAEGEAAAQSEPGEPFVHRLVRFIRSYALWIIIVLVVAFVAIAGWVFLGSRKGGRDPGLAELGMGAEASRPAPQPGRRFSSTKIAASAVNRRLTGAVTTTEVETDREYALVVDEEALKMPPLPEDAAAQQADSPAIEKLLAAKDLEGAYKEYQRQVDQGASLVFDPRVEMAL